MNVELVARNIKGKHGDAKDLFKKKIEDRIAIANVEQRGCKNNKSMDSDAKDAVKELKRLGPLLDPARPPVSWMVSEAYRHRYHTRIQCCHH